MIDIKELKRIVRKVDKKKPFYSLSENEKYLKKLKAEETVVFINNSRYYIKFKCDYNVLDVTVFKNNGFKNEIYKLLEEEC